MKVFITGSTGLLGSTLLRNAPSGHILSASYHSNTLLPNVKCAFIHMELTSRKSVIAAIEKAKPDLVIHTAAIATPDYCDKNQDEAWAVNVKGTSYIIAACKKVGAKLIYITTNGVYDGKKAPYSEEALPKPIDFYGKTKYEGEKMVASSGLHYNIVRLITMHGWNNPKSRENPLTWQLRILGQNKTPINMVNDMFNNFLSVVEASKAIWKVAEGDFQSETFNIAGKNCISRYDFACDIARVFDMDETMITPVSLKFFSNMVPRPKNTCFTTTKMHKVLKLKPLTTVESLKELKKNPLTYSDWKEV